MSEQDNMYENHPPVQDVNIPDYSNSQHKVKHSRHGGRTAAIISLSILLLLFAVAAVGMGGYYVGKVYVWPYLESMREIDGGFDILLPEDLNGINGGKPNSNGQTANKPNEKFEAPEFNYSDGSEIDLSTNLTDIYSACAPSCCTVRVSVNGQLYSIGSGFVIDAKNGYIATNHHVISGGDSVDVVFYNGNSYTAKIVGSNSVTDLAVLKIDAEGLVALTFGNSDNVSVGENVVAIGTPYDQSLAGTMTCGIISGVARNIDITNESGKVIKTMTLLQTDCSINPGNSGGPLIDMAGNVIGITSLKLVDEQFEGIGFAIPITAAADIFEKLIAGENIGNNDLANAAPQIGVTVYELEAGLQAFRMYPSCDYPKKGVIVSEISRSSAAYIAGLSTYDIITDFDGVEITCLADLTSALENYRAGDEVTITVFRFNRSLTRGETMTITFVLDAAE